MEELIKHIIGSPSEFGVGWVVLLIAAAITIFVPIVQVSRSIIRFCKRKSVLLKKIALLDTSCHSSYFISVLGDPVHINSIKSETGQIFNESIFVNRFFYVQTIVDVQGSVLLFSVTTRRKNFNPILRTQFGDFVVQLGKTRFSELGSAADKKPETNGDHGAITYYSETHYLGYGGGYRDFAFTYNPNGFGKLAIATDNYIENNAKQFRDTVINTFTVISKKDIPCNYFGPKHYQIRVFKNNI